MDPHEDMELHTLVKTQAERYAAPAALRESIISSLHRADTTTRVASKTRDWRLWLNMGAALSLGIVISTVTAYLFFSVSAQQRLAHEVVASHVRSLMGNHLTDVASLDSHTVKPWFAGKLDFSPPVHDLSAAGFPLVGGRLDYLEGRPTAALIYQRRKHTINVFVWPRDSRSPTPPIAFTAQGFNVTGWNDGAMQFWLVSDINVHELQQFAQRLREATLDTAS